MWHVWKRGEMLTEFWWGSMRDGKQLEYRRCWKYNIKMELQEVDRGGLV
jgi:hypothetical protein